MKQKKLFIFCFVMLVIIIEFLPESCQKSQQTVDCDKRLGKTRSICKSLRGIIFGPYRDDIYFITYPGLKDFIYYKASITKDNNYVKVWWRGETRLVPKEYKLLKHFTLVGIATHSNNYVRNVINSYVNYSEDIFRLNKVESILPADYEYPENKPIRFISHLNLDDEIRPIEKQFEYYFFVSNFEIAHMRWSEDKQIFEKIFYVASYARDSKTSILLQRNLQFSHNFNFRLYKRGYVINSKITLFRKYILNRKDKEIDVGEVIQFDMSITGIYQKITIYKFVDFIKIMDEYNNPGEPPNPPLYALQKLKEKKTHDLSKNHTTEAANITKPNVNIAMDMSESLVTEPQEDEEEEEEEKSYKMFLYVGAVVVLGIVPLLSLIISLICIMTPFSKRTRDTTFETSQTSTDMFSSKTKKKILKNFLAKSPTFYPNFLSSEMSNSSSQIESVDRSSKPNLLSQEINRKRFEIASKSEVLSKTLQNFSPGRKLNQTLKTGSTSAFPNKNIFTR